ncbi:MAG: methyltransferase, TIGR04325 family [Chitinophagaceae bacterium]
MDKLVQFLKRQYIKMKYYRYGWRGNYPSWSAAEKECQGYHAGNILEKVKAATLKVKYGEAVYERDAMLFDKIEYSWPLLANLLWIASRKAGSLSVIDFGGSLGSSYFQNRHYLSQLKEVKWSVVEQPAFAAAGKAAIAGEQLDFFDTIDDAISSRGQHDVLLVSCVLPYIEKPLALLTEMASKNIPYIIIENTYFNPLPGNRLTIQKVPPVYYEASYPAWFLDYDEVVMALSQKYDLVTSYNNEQILYLDGELLPYKGFVMQLKSES